MVFADLQRQMNEGWRRSKKEIDLVHAKKVNACPKCLKQGFKVKMDLMKDGITKLEMSKMKFEIWGCPRCKYLDKKYFRIEGRGKSGVNLGREYGGI